MEPLDTDMDYMERAPRAANPGSRFNAILILPTLGVLLMLFFIASIIFQFSIADLVDSLMGLMTLFFIVLVVMLFWAMAPRSSNTRG